MNLIDFWVKEIKTREYNKLYKLFEMTYEEAEETTWLSPEDEGVKIICEVVDMGGCSIKTEYFNLTRGEVPYEVGYRGLH